MSNEMVGDVPADVLGTLEDIIGKLRKRAITPDELKRFAKRENPFADSTATSEAEKEAAKLLSKRFGKTIAVDSLPKDFTKQNLERWAHYNLKPVFLPKEKITEDSKIKSWVKPERWLYSKIREGKIAEDSVELRGGWYLADFTSGTDYTDGTQVFPNDPLAPLIERLRREGKVGKYDKTPLGSRFAITNDEWWGMVCPELAKELEVNPKQVRLERAIEFNAIGNLYDANRGKFNSWEWFEDAFEGSGRLDGGARGSGGLSRVSRDGSDCRCVGIAGRPLVSFIK